MPFPDVDTEFETFFEPTRIWLFGKRFRSLEYNPGSMGAAGSNVGEFSTGYVVPQEGSLPMPPKRIERTLRRGSSVAGNGQVTPPQGDEEQFFARIYSFTYEAHYYRLPRPLLFLVNHPGYALGGGQPETEEDDQPAPADAIQPPDGTETGKLVGVAKSYAQAQARSEARRRERMRARFSAKFTGVEARDWNFSNDILVWAVDRKDLTVCLDVEIGNYQEILLDSMLVRDRREDDRATRSRGDLIGRGGGSFRGDMIGPHQNK